MGLGWVMPPLTDPGSGRILSFRHPQDKLASTRKEAARVQEKLEKENKSLKEAADKVHVVAGGALLLALSWRRTLMRTTGRGLTALVCDPAGMVTRQRRPSARSSR